MKGQAPVTEPVDDSPLPVADSLLVPLLDTAATVLQVLDDRPTCRACCARSAGSTGAG